MNAARKPVFYGWWIAVAAAVGFGLGSPAILVFCFPIFLKALTKEFHASRATISLAFSLHNLVSASAAPIAGRLIDRVGIRRVVLPGTLLFAAWLLANRFITVSVFGIYLFNMVGALIGMGCGPLPFATAISNWFDRRRGAALAVMMIGVGVSNIIMPPLVQRVISAYGWRTAYAFYGFAILFISLPLVAILMKDKPQSMGLFPDGVSSSSHAAVGGLSGITSREALRTSTFWVLIAAVVLLGGSVHACVIHLTPLLTDRGMSFQTAALASSIAGFGLLIGRVGTGLLLDKFFAPRVAMCISGGAALAIVLLLTNAAGATPFVAAFLAGTGMGAETDVIAFLTSRYFGLKSFGEMFGFCFGAYVVSGAGAVLLMGIGFDRTGSYTAPLIGFLVAVLIAILLFSRLGPYRYMPPRHETAVGELQVLPAAP
jgi:MFS family permease